MGEVWRARDTKLGREVAIKTLPEEFASDPDRLARFQREAEVLASLNHPNIAAIYGLEDTGETKALVMELIEGPTLADRIAQGRIPVDETLLIARQIAQALEAAHEQNVVHRDLKPANVKVSDDGTVKVLDFGLAKAMEPAGDSSSVSMSPTLSMAATQQGLILGTAAYMSPEQAKGRPVDKRTDIWAFGAVLYEMLTGKLAFQADDVSDTLATILMKEPDWTAVSKAVPSVVTSTIQRCLQKDRKERIRDIGDAGLALRGAFDTHQVDETIAVVRPTWSRLMPWAFGAVIGGILVAATAWFVTRPVAMPVERFSLSLEGGSPVWISNGFQDIAISPNGQQIVYSTRGDAPGLQILFLSEGEPTSLVAGVGGQPTTPFFSPDGRWVGFYDQTSQALKRVSVNGGPVETIAQVGIQLRGASWSPDGTIVYASSTSRGLWRVSATGGETEQLTALGEGEFIHSWPSVLPDGQGVLFTIATSEATNPRLAVLSLDTLRWEILAVEGTAPQYVSYCQEWCLGD